MAALGCAVGGAGGHGVSMSAGADTLPAVTVRDRMCLTIATAHYRHPGARVADMRELVGYSETRFWARVRHLVRHPEVIAAMPAECRRIVGLQERRRRWV